MAEQQYKYEYQASIDQKRNKIFLIVYGILILVSITVGIAMRLQGIKEVRTTPTFAAKTTYNCVFCTSAGVDPAYQYVNDPSIVYCVTTNDKNIPIQDAQIQYDYFPYNDNGTQDKIISTDPHGLATYGNATWSSTSKTLESGLTRTLLPKSISSTFTYSGIDYTITNPTPINQNACSSYFPVPYKRSTTNSTTANGPCCTGSPTLTCKTTCTLDFVGNNKYSWDKVNDNQCNGANAITGYNPLRPPANDPGTGNYWSPAPPALPKGDTGSTNLIDDYVTYQGPLLKFQLACTAGAACKQIDTTPVDLSTVKVGETVRLTAKTTSPNDGGAKKWYLVTANGTTTEICKNAQGEGTATCDFQVPDNQLYQIFLRVGDEINSTKTPIAACRKSIKAGGVPTGIPTVNITATKTGPPCVERVSPNNIATFTITVTNPSLNPATITKITDVQPQGFSYVAGTTSINGVSSPADDPTVTKVDGAVTFTETLEWTNNTKGWIVPASSNLILTFNSEATNGSTTGENINSVVIDIKDQPSIDNITHVFQVEQFCGTPDTGLFDETRNLLLMGILLMMAGATIVWTNKPARWGSSLFKSINTNIDTTLQKLSDKKHLTSRHKLDKSIKKYLDKEKRKD